MKDNRNSLVTVLSCSFALVAYLIADSVIAGQLTVSAAQNKVTAVQQVTSVEQVLKQVHQ